jgi:hypothetical protein
MDEDDDGWCDICGEDYSGESHYHCGNCGEVTGMFGHFNPEAEGFFCQPRDEMSR